MGDDADSSVPPPNLLRATVNRVTTPDSEEPYEMQVVCSIGDGNLETFEPWFKRSCTEVLQGISGPAGHPFIQPQDDWKWSINDLSDDDHTITGKITFQFTNIDPVGADRIATGFRVGVLSANPEDNVPRIKGLEVSCTPRSNINNIAQVSSNSKACPNTEL